MTTNAEGFPSALDVLGRRCFRVVAGTWPVKPSRSEVAEPRVACGVPRHSCQRRGGRRLRWEPDSYFLSAVVAGSMTENEIPALLSRRVRLSPMAVAVVTWPALRGLSS